MHQFVKASACKRRVCLQKGLCVKVCVCDTSEETKNFYRLSFYVLYLSKSCRGTELSDATLSNEAMHQRGKHPLATDVYLPKIVWKVVWTVDQAVTLPCFAESFADHSFADNSLFIVHVYFADRGFVFRRTSWYSSLFLDLPPIWWLFWTPWFFRTMGCG